MARVATYGAELNGDNSIVESAGAVIANGSSNGRLPGGHALELNGFVAGTAPGAYERLIFVALQDHYWIRGYFFVRTMPGSGGLRIIGGTGQADQASEDAWYLVLGSDGILRGYNDGADARTLLGTAGTPLVAGQWYRLNIEVKFRDTVGNNSNLLALKINGTLQFSASTTGSLFGGLNYWAGSAAAGGAAHGTQVTLTPFNTAANEHDGGSVLWDDLVVDNTTEPAAGGVTLLHVTGNGIDTGWTVGGDWRAVVHAPPTWGTGVAGVSNTTPGAARTFTVESLTSKGLGSVTIKSVRLVIFGLMPRNNWQFRIYKNGVATTGPVLALQAAQQWLSDPASPGRSWLIDAGTLALSAGDSIEIGLVDGPSGAGTAEISGAYLLVDWEGADPTPDAESSDIVIETGTYVGTGTVKEVLLANATVKPTLLIIAGEAAGLPAKLIWARGWGESGDWSIDGASNKTRNPNLSRVYTGGFTVQGGAGTLNVSGTTYRWVAIRDNAKRMIHTGARVLNAVDGGVVDNFDVPLPDAPALVIDALLSLSGSWVSGASTGRMYYRDVNYTGDSSSALDANTAAAADSIQSQGTGTFQLGKVGTRLNVDQNQWIAISQQATVFTLRQLVKIGTYIGNGAGSRVIAAAGLGTVPSLLMVVPENTGLRYYRFFNDGAGTTSRDWVGGNTITTAITAFATQDEFTVNSTLNVNLVVYHYLMFGSGTDPATAPEVELPEGGIGLTWVEITQADGSLDVWSKVALADPSDYYGGYKEDRVTQWGRLTRALSDQAGQMEGVEFTWDVADTDRVVRAMLGADTTKYFKNRPVVVRMIDDASRRLQLTPRTVLRGIVTDYKPLSQLHFHYQARDLLTAKFAALGKNPAQVPTRKIALTDFPYANAPIVRTVEGGGAATTVGAVDKAVPIIYGSVSDKVLTAVEVPFIPPFDPDPNFRQPAQHANDKTGIGGTITGSCGAYVLPYRAGFVGRIRGFFAGTSWDTPHAVSFRWEPMEGAESYYVFFFDRATFNPWGGHGAPPPQFGRLIIHDLTETFPGDDRPFQQIVHNFTEGIDVLGGGLGSTTTYVDSGKGAVLPIYVGDYTIGGVVYRGALICGHAIKAIVGGYLNDKPVDLATDTDWLTPNRAAAWAAAGFTTPYTDINGRRYTIVYLKGDAGDTLAGNMAPLVEGSPGVAFNIDGIETNGDGTGTLIVDVHQQYKHAIINWMLQTYASGAWLTAPTFADEVTLAQVDSASFDRCSSVATGRMIGTEPATDTILATHSAGYVGAGIIGASNEFVTVRDLAALFNLSGDCDLGFNRHGQLMISMISESIAAQASAVQLTDVNDVDGGSFDISDDLQGHFNQIPYLFAFDYTHRPVVVGALAGRDGWNGAGLLTDAVSITNYTVGTISGEEKAPDLHLSFVRHQATAVDIAGRRLMRMKNPPRHAKISVGLSGHNRELGEIIQLTHYEGIGAAGWVGRPLRIIRHEADPDAFQVHLEVFDMAVLFEGAFILGDEATLPASWPSATTAQRSYGYLADETTGLFSDGAKGKRLR